MGLIRPDTGLMVRFPLKAMACLESAISDQA
jgi:hypothetical protein